MPRIIVKALRKRNETGLVFQISACSLGKYARIRSFPPINLYKSTRRERLNLYRCAFTPAPTPTWISSTDATAQIEIRKTQSQCGIALLLGEEDIIW